VSRRPVLSRELPALGARAALLVLVAGTPGGCGDTAREDLERYDRAMREEEEARSNSFPDATMIRFREVRSEGFERESWELEVLQMGDDIRLRGSIRTAGSSVPIYQRMGSTEFSKLWTWLERFPLDGHRVAVRETVPEEDWEKTFELDVVLGPDRRLLCRNTWTRPLQETDWVRLVEDHLHAMTLSLAEKEVGRMESEPEAVPTPAPAETLRAMEALGLDVPPPPPETPRPDE
jgi:hypothetical protein